MKRKRYEKKRKSSQRRWSWITRKMTFRLLFLLILCGILSLSCFRYLMQWQTRVYEGLVKKGYIEFEPGKIIEELQEKAEGINFKDHSKKEILELLEIEKYDDGYTSIIFYGEDDKFQFYGLEPQAWDSMMTDVFWYNDVSMYNQLDRSGEIKFRDTREVVMIYSMHQALIVMPYFLIALSLSLLLFLPAIFYVWNRMRYVGKLKKEILIMADGDLEHPITAKGKDEIGVLAENLDQMRLTLEQNIRREQEGKKANRDLISSISHDLRTPLTTLYGYLEIVEQKKCSQQKQEEYIRRCIEKVEEIRTLSDKMFEYALVYEKDEQVELSELYLNELLENLERDQEFLKLKGFSVQTRYQVSGLLKIQGSALLFQRMFNNLFSNIIKYGEKEKPVQIEITVEKGSLEMRFLNWKKSQKTHTTESNKIGLKSVRKMVELQEGSLFVAEEEEIFAVTMRFPLYD
ncbi:MAG: HAMP domain-containing histidine kinase [Lachnospiraceae bacterium]|nr:HAMP domain-containing histidine kinase [Lachnospiraceae bacterium]